MTPAELASAHAAGFADSRSWSAEEFATFLADPATVLCGDPECFALGRVTLDEAELLTIVTAPHARGRGRAGTIMADWLAAARAGGATHAFLEVAEDNAAARALYRRHGFVATGRRRRYYPRASGIAADGLIMARDLTQG